MGDGAQKGGALCCGWTGLQSAAACAAAGVPVVVVEIQCAFERVLVQEIQLVCLEGHHGGGHPNKRRAGGALTILNKDRACVPGWMI